MNFYIQFTTLNYKTRHAIAVELNRLFPSSKFAATADSHGNVARRYLERQKVIKYKFMPGHLDSANRALREDADFELLKEFEETLPEKSLWRIMAVDRSWGYQFLKGVYLPKFYIHTINTHENILKIASGLIKFFKEVLTDFKPDVFIPAAGQNNMLCPILEQLCKNYNILYIMPETARTQNYMALTDNRQCTFSQINETYRQLIAGKLNMDLSSGERCYDEITSDLENTGYYDISNIDCLKLKYPWLRFLYRSLRATAMEIVRWQKGRGLRKNKNTIFKQPDNIKILIDNIGYAILMNYRRVQLINPKFYSKFEPNQKYLYFPLHNTNEYSTQVCGTMWINQLQIIEALAKSIPFDWKIVVKEHPGMLFCRVRPMSFYKEIKSYSNVLLIPTDTSSNAVINNAQLIVTITGTTAWEAIIRGKPVIDFEENISDVLGLSRRCTDFKKLSIAIHDEVQRVKNIPLQERKRRIVCLLTAIIKHGFWIDNPLNVTGDAPCESELAAREIGKIIARAIKEYIDYSARSTPGGDRELVDY